MDKYRRLPLRTLKHRKVFYNQIIIEEELKQLKSIKHNLDNQTFSDKVIKTTPKQDLTLTIDKAYEYIKETKDINKETIKQLYDILSEKELEKKEIEGMGKYYRNTLEYISSNKLLIEKIGPNPEEIDYYMDQLIDFINGENIEDFIKSQIIHQYLVYIHPYPNVNGRMSRMLSSWYLIKNKKYSCILFNRVSSYKPNQYNEKIKSIYKHGNITPFLSFIIKETKKHLEKMILLEKINKIDIDTYKIIECLLYLENPTLESLNRLNTIQNKYLSNNKILEILSVFIKEKIIEEKEGHFHINRKKLSQIK